MTIPARRWPRLVAASLVYELPDQEAPADQLAELITRIPGDLDMPDATISAVVIARGPTTTVRIEVRRPGVIAGGMTP